MKIGSVVKIVDPQLMDTLGKVVEILDRGIAKAFPKNRFLVEIPDQQFERIYFPEDQLRVIDPQQVYYVNELSMGKRGAYLFDDLSSAKSSAKSKASYYYETMAVWGSEPEPICIRHKHAWYTRKEES